MSIQQEAIAVRLVTADSLQDIESKVIAPGRRTNGKKYHADALTEAYLLILFVGTSKCRWQANSWSCFEALCLYLFKQVLPKSNRHPNKCEALPAYAAFGGHQNCKENVFNAKSSSCLKNNNQVTLRYKVDKATSCCVCPQDGKCPQDSTFLGGSSEVLLVFAELLSGHVWARLLKFGYRLLFGNVIQNEQQAKLFM